VVGGDTIAASHGQPLQRNNIDWAKTQTLRNIAAAVIAFLFRSCFDDRSAKKQNALKA